MQNFAKKAVLGLVMSGLAACSTPTIDQAGQSVKATDKVVGELMSSSRQSMPKAATGPVSVSQDVFLGGEATFLKRGKPLPTAVEREGVTLSAYTDQDIVQIADLIQATTGIVVSVGGDAIAYSNTEGEGASHPRRVPVEYKGKLSGFLNQVTTAMGLNWRYVDGEIQIYYQDTVTYVMKVLPATQTMSTGISGGSGGGGEGGSSNQESSSAFEINLWDEIVTAVQGIAGDGTVTASRSSGTISVTAPAERLKRVNRYVEEQNARLSQQVATNVQVFNVSMRDSAELGTDLLSLAFNNSDIGNFGYASTGGNDVAQAGSLGWTLLKPLSGVSDVSGIVRALNSKGDVSVVTTANATTLNNTPVPIQVGNDRHYVSAVTETVDEDGGVSTDIVTSNINTGFNMQLLPRIMSQGVVALQLNVLTNELIGASDGFEQFSLNGNTIQLPNINKRAFTNQVAIPNGHTLVLSGFEQTTSRMDKSGTGAADNWFMGGRHAGSMEREVMVILITPVIVDTGKLIERVGG